MNEHYFIINLKSQDKSDIGEDIIVGSIYILDSIIYQGNIGSRIIANYI